MGCRSGSRASPRSRRSMPRPSWPGSPAPPPTPAGIGGAASFRGPMPRRPRPSWKGPRRRCSNGLPASGRGSTASRPATARRASIAPCCGCAPPSTTWCFAASWTRCAASFPNGGKAGEGLGCRPKRGAGADLARRDGDGHAPRHHRRQGGNDVGGGPSCRPHPPCGRAPGIPDLCGIRGANRRPPRRRLDARCSGGAARHLPARAGGPAPCGPAGYRAATVRERYRLRL